MQTFNQWDIQKDVNAINETGWATFQIDNFGDFDQHFNTAFDTIPSTSSTLSGAVQQPSSIVTYSSSMLTNNSIGTIGDQMSRNHIVNGHYNNHCHNIINDNDVGDGGGGGVGGVGSDLFGDFECHQTQRNNLFDIIGNNGFDFDPFTNEKFLDNNNATTIINNDMLLQQNETDNLNLINSMTTTVSKNNIIIGADDSSNDDNIIVQIQQQQHMILLNDHDRNVADDKPPSPPPIVPSIENVDQENDKIVLSVEEEDVKDNLNESTSAM